MAHVQQLLENGWLVYFMIANFTMRANWPEPLTKVRWNRSKYIVPHYRMLFGFVDYSFATSF